MTQTAAAIGNIELLSFSLCEVPYKGVSLLTREFSSVSVVTQPHGDDGINRFGNTRFRSVSLRLTCLRHRVGFHFNLVNSWSELILLLNEANGNWTFHSFFLTWNRIDSNLRWIIGDDWYIVSPRVSWVWVTDIYEFLISETQNKNRA